MKQPRVLGSLALLISSCAHTGQAPAAAPANEPTEPDTSGPVADLSSPRSLPPEADYADLVRAAGLLDGQDQAPEEPCLLARHASEHTLAAEIAAAVRPLPQPTGDLDSQLARVSSAHVLTPYGAYGTANDALTLASFTRFAPAPQALVLTVTDQGVSARGAGRSDASAGPAALAETLNTLGALEGVLVFVAAEAQVQVTRLHDVLAALSERGAAVALAVALPEGTRLPTPPTPPASRALPCPEGLPETQEPEGELSRDALLSGLSPLREGALACLLRGGAASAAGGTLTTALRVDAQGAVSHACLVQSEFSDTAVTGCVLDLARSLHFAPPQPPGVVTVELPLALRPHSVPAQKPVCALTGP
jgi:hypothetical protein